jgi:hypothetical protein
MPIAQDKSVYKFKQRETQPLITKPLAILLSAIVFALSLSFPAATRAQTSEAQATQTARTSVQTMGVNTDRRVEIKLRDKTKVKGYITRLDQDSFSVTDSKTGASQTLSYSDVQDVKKASSGWSSKNWLILGGVAAGIVVTSFVVKSVGCDGGAQTRGIC